MNVRFPRASRISSWLACAAALAATSGVCAEPVTGPEPAIPDSNVIPIRHDAPAPTAHFGFVLQGTGHFGGDKMAEIYFEDESKQSVRVGTGLSLDAGLHYTTVSNIDFRGTIGYKYVTTKADNADIHIGRIVWKGMIDYLFPENWFLGAGVEHHSAIKFHGDGIAPNLKFDSATGYAIEAGWRFFGVSYTFMDYKDEFGNKYDANNVGIFLIGRF